jgi:hypothetical protein
VWYKIRTAINRQDALFQSRQTVALFAQVLGEVSQRFVFEIRGLSLKDERLVFYIKPKDGFKLPQIMQWLKQTFCVRYNFLHGLKGHTWGDRYWSKILEGEPPPNAEPWTGPVMGVEASEFSPEKARGRAVREGLLIRADPGQGGLRRGSALSQGNPPKIGLAARLPPAKPSGTPPASGKTAQNPFSAIPPPTGDRRSPPGRLASPLGTGLRCRFAARNDDPTDDSQAPLGNQPPIIYYFLFIISLYKLVLMADSQSPYR